MLAEGHVNSNDMYGWFPLQVQATVQVKENDRVHAQLVEGSIHGDGAEEHLITTLGGFLINQLDIIE